MPLLFNFFYYRLSCPSPPEGRKKEGGYMNYFIKKSKLLFLRLSLSFKSFFFFFLMWASFNVFTEFVTKLPLFYALFFFWPRGMWDPSSLARD